MNSNCGCDPKKYVISCCTTPVLGPIENYYTKNQIDRMIDEIEQSGCCITEDEVDEKIESAKTEIESEMPSLSGYATEQWVEDKHYITGVDLSNYATLDDIPDLAGYALKSEIPTSNSALTNDAGYLTEHQPLKTINNQSLVGTGNIEIGTGGTIDLSNYYTKSETNSQIGSATAGMATQQWVLDKHYISGVDLSNYATLQDIPTVPTSNSAFTNDMGYLTEHQQLKTINNQSLLGSGNINIEGGSSVTVDPGLSTSSTNPVANSAITNAINTISAVTSSHDSQISNFNARIQQVRNEMSDNYLLKNKIWCGTQSQYDSIATKDSETIYLIHE